VIETEIAKLSLPRETVLKPLGDFEEVKVGMTHPKFEELLDQAKIRINSLAVGPAGSGKTFASQQVFNALLEIPQELGGFKNKSLTVDNNFVVVSCHGEMMPSDIVGPMIPQISPKEDGEVEVHRMTNLVKVYRDGGVLVLDEFDALVGDTAIAVNSALSGDSWTMPDGIVIKKSEDFFCLATANTFGNGAGRGAYSARNKLDGATLNRFAGGIIHWDYDTDFERNIIQDDEICDFFQDLRSTMKETGIQRIISPRHMLSAKKQKEMLKWDMSKIKSKALADWTEKDLRTVGMTKSFIDRTIGGAC